MKKVCLAFLCSCLLVTFTKAQQDSIPSFVKDSLDNYVNRSLAEWKIPGAAVCVIKDGKVVVM